MNTEECCNHNCNQGRDCPLRKAKPVAWMNKEANVFAQHEEGAKNFGCTIPPYTHPVQKPMMVLDGNRVYPAFKELTDEEIEEIAIEAWGSGHEVFWFDDDGINLFARSILRKAQENG